MHFSNTGDSQGLSVCVKRKTLGDCPPTDITFSQVYFHDVSLFSLPYQTYREPLIQAFGTFQSFQSALQFSIAVKEMPTIRPNQTIPIIVKLLHKSNLGDIVHQSWFYAANGAPFICCGCGVPLFLP